MARSRDGGAGPGTGLLVWAILLVYLGFHLDLYARSARWLIDFLRAAL